MIVFEWSEKKKCVKRLTIICIIDATKNNNIARLDSKAIIPRY